jgi:hypothetical protein
MILYLTNSGLHVHLDQSARPLALGKLPRIANGAIVARGMVETLWQPGFDGEWLYLDAFGLLSVRGWIDRHWPALQPATLDRRFARYVTSMGHRDQMVRLAEYLTYGTGDRPYGESAFITARVVDQLRRGAGHVKASDQWPTVQARLAATKL